MNECPYMCKRAGANVCSKVALLCYVTIRTLLTGCLEWVRHAPYTTDTARFTTQCLQLSLWWRVGALDQASVRGCCCCCLFVVASMNALRRQSRCSGAGGCCWCCCCCHCRQCRACRACAGQCKATRKNASAYERRRLCVPMLMPVTMLALVAHVTWVLSVLSLRRVIPLLHYAIQYCAGARHAVSLDVLLYLDHHHPCSVACLFARRTVQLSYTAIHTVLYRLGPQYARGREVACLLAYFGLTARQLLSLPLTDWRVEGVTELTSPPPLVCKEQAESDAGKFTLRWPLQDNRQTNSEHYYWLSEYWGRRWQRELTDAAFRCGAQPAAVRVCTKADSRNSGPTAKSRQPARGYVARIWWRGRTTLARIVSYSCGA